MLRAPIASVLLVLICFAAAPAQEPSRADSILTPDRRVRLTVDRHNWVTGERRHRRRRSNGLSDRQQYRAGAVGSGAPRVDPRGHQRRLGLGLTVSLTPAR